ncbi:ribokinase isoform X2 [Galendromus occidentalis]|nr:ribokinase isoform X2 [Galendromus occidentalis]XP_028966917.1 ribokinase isoform X2 [Galendromus occidentalis]
MPQAVVLGGLVTDLLTYAPRFPVAGETLVAHGFQIGFGGKGANTAYMCVQLGLETALLAKLGDDQFGENYLRYLKTAGMDTSHVTVQKNCKTSASVITVTDSGENTIVYYPGAADELVEEDVDRAEHLFRGAKVFASVFETKLCNVKRGVEIAKRNGLITYVNAAPIVPDPFPVEMLPQIDYLCLNEVEGSALVCKLKGIPTESLEEQEIVDYLLQHGGNTIILTRGAKGAAFATGYSPLSRKLIGPKSQWPEKPLSRTVSVPKTHWPEKMKAQRCFYAEMCI